MQRISARPHSGHRTAESGARVPHAGQAAGVSPSSAQVSSARKSALSLS